jgi:FkbM family methyltransferase
MKESIRIYSALLALLSRFRPYARGTVLRALYSALHKLWDSEGPPVRTKLHGVSVLLNRGNTYPLILSDFPTFNAPLVELVHQSARATKMPLTFVDVGAATGDTVLLIKARCPGVVRQFICIEGDSEFHELLLANTRQFKDVTVVHALLARESMQIRSLVKHHKGTASATGESMVQAIRLDSLASIQSVSVDVLKIDVDGFDGEVIAGAVETLSRCRPFVLFEWHPKLTTATCNSPLCAFETLAHCGYDRFAWFHNIGTFSHFSVGYSPDVLQKQMHYLLAVNSRADEHFDIISLHRDAKFDEVALARMDFARSFLSPRDRKRYN